MNLVRTFSWIILLLMFSPISYGHVAIQHTFESGSGLLLHVLTQPGHFSLLVLAVFLVVFRRQLMHIISNLLKDGRRD